MDIKRRTGLLVAVAGAGLALGGLVVGGQTSATAVPTQQVSLHNDTAAEGTDCPDETNDYWHFIIAPNNGTFHFVSIHLVVDGTGYDFSAWSSILKNGSQEDNVFVQVPAGKTLADIEKTGSYAVMTPDTPAPTNFTLSHLCDGTPVDTTDGTTIPETTSPETTSPETTSPETTSPETTSPETTSPETTSPETTSPETTSPETTSPETTSPETTSPETTSPETTSPDTTSPDTTQPATTAPDTTTGDTGGEGNSTLPSTSQGSGGGLPGTGSDNSSLVMLGAFMIVAGVTMSTMTRRRTAR